ncbi:MAG: glycosyltransferase [Chloroflexi bacterium]|nr:glycosyltransferase [Chloroflexota bacterium]
MSVSAPMRSRTRRANQVYIENPFASCVPRHTNPQQATSVYQARVSLSPATLFRGEIRQNSISPQVGAFQTVSDVVIQKSTREGFGLVVTKPLWKGKPVVGGNVGGIPLQVIEGETGFLADSVEECAQKALYLLEHPEEAVRMGKAAREQVRRNFLTTRHLADYLRLFSQLLAG